MLCESSLIVRIFVHVFPLAFFLIRNANFFVWQSLRRHFFLFEHKSLWRLWVITLSHNPDENVTQPGTKRAPRNLRQTFLEHWNQTRTHQSLPPRGIQGKRKHFKNKDLPYSKTGKILKSFFIIFGYQSNVPRVNYD